MVILRKRIAGAGREPLERFAERARRAVRVRGEVTVLVTGSSELRQLNRSFRGKDKPTDVLSFPSGERGLAGDIAISADIARANARELGHSVEEEIRILMLHGLLHLAGYDHETDDGAMARREERLRRQLDLPVALIGRTAGRAGRKR